MGAHTAAMPRGGFRHEALIYSDHDEFLQGTSNFIRAGIESDEPMLVVLGAAKIRALRSELNDDADRVLFADMADVGANPARIIPAWRDFVDEHGRGDRPVRGIGEPIWPERSEAELVECQRHESLLNVAFADAGSFHLLCPYDASALSPDVLDEAARSHPFSVTSDGTSENAGYRGVDGSAAPLDAPLPDPPARPDSRVFQRYSLGAVRALVAAHATAAGLPRDGVEEFTLAVSEVATNSVLHGGGGGVARVWQEDDAVVCEVSDRGFIDEPLAGRVRPAPGPGGHGLWMANQLCDLVQIRTSEHGSVVRLRKHG